MLNILSPSLVSPSLWAMSTISFVLITILNFAIFVLPVTWGVLQGTEENLRIDVPNWNDESGLTTGRKLCPLRIGILVGTIIIGLILGIVIP